MPLIAEQLLRRPKEELDCLFRDSPAGPLPDGEATGTAIVFSGTLCARLVAWWVRWFGWQGKCFDAAAGALVNRIGPFSCRAIRARVYHGPSWVDQKEAVVLDYSTTSVVARKIRDEIREVSPGLWLGKVWWGRRPLIHFAVSLQYQPERKFWRRIWATAGLVALLGAGALAWRFTRDVPVTYADAVSHFKYGSLGGERDAGIPKAMWKLFPVLFRKHLPGDGLQSLGFVFEDGLELPVGVSERNVQGIDRVFVNCAVCHVGTVRDTPESAPRVIAGMPANTLDLQAFERFLFACATDEQFNAGRIVPEIAQREWDDWLNRTLFRLVAVDIARQRLLTLRQRFSFMDREPDAGPGRVDTFNPPKVLLNFPMDKLPTNEWVGLCDFPSIWNQAKREGMWLHWDGNNNSVEERNRSAAFGTGALPSTLDRPGMRRVEAWIATNVPPPWPYGIDRALAERGAPIYAQHCARCHGRSGSDFTGELVGKVTPIEEIGTDRHRLDSYTLELCVNQNLLYAAYPEERFRHFRKTQGYANQPLDGLWLRGPYLHNGSVPTLRELLEPAARRTKVFHRGYDVIDRKNVGFISDVAEEKGRTYFKFDTGRPGNGNQGHEGEAYGTHLPAADKDAIVEYLKTF